MSITCLFLLGFAQSSVAEPLTTYSLFLGKTAQVVDLGRDGILINHLESGGLQIDEDLPIEISARTLYSERFSPSSHQELDVAIYEEGLHIYLPQNAAILQKLQHFQQQPGFLKISGQTERTNLLKIASRSKHPLIFVEAGYSVPFIRFRDPVITTQLRSIPGLEFAEDCQQTLTANSRRIYKTGLGNTLSVIQGTRGHVTSKPKGFQFTVHTSTK